jgi:hypothetical protein
MKGYYIVGILTFMMIMQSLVFALIPPPPVNQMIGVYDTTFINLDENKCRN